MHAPLWHVSVCVHALPSLHAVPLASGGLEHSPVAGLHVPTAWHWSLAVHWTAAQLPLSAFLNATICWIQPALPASGTLAL